MSFFYRFLAVLWLIGVSYAAQAQKSMRYQYMHIYFTSGMQPANSPVVVFSPALKGEKEVRVEMPPTRPASSDIPKTKLSNSAGKVWVQGADGQDRPQTPEEAQRETAARNQAQEQFQTAMTQWAERKQDALAKALDKAGEDGWEVVQIISPSAGYMVYLLRKQL